MSRNHQNALYFAAVQTISMHNFSLVVMAIQIQHKFTALLCLILWRDWRPRLFSVEIVNNQSKKISFRT